MSIDVCLYVSTVYSYRVDSKVLILTKYCNNQKTLIKTSIYKLLNNDCELVDSITHKNTNLLIVKREHERIERNWLEDRRLWVLYLNVCLSIKRKLSRLV